MKHRSSSSRTSPESSPEEKEEQLPTYNPFSDAARREKQRIRAAENAVHVIPLVLLLCVFLLWFFSFPEANS